jgi:hypothetical protein
MAILTQHGVTKSQHFCKIYGLLRAPFESRIVTQEIIDNLSFLTYFLTYLTIDKVKSSVRLGRNTTGLNKDSRVALV